MKLCRFIVSEKKTYFVSKTGIPLTKMFPASNIPRSPEIWVDKALCPWENRYEQVQGSMHQPSYTSPDSTRDEDQFLCSCRPRIICKDLASHETTWETTVPSLFYGGKRTHGIVKQIILPGAWVLRVIQQKRMI